ncbi:sensor histidine kinase [Pseudonocardia sp. GCM10023141]|uniref:sensor histidine kinase n=1 Tax=Pseudonocardia sp. GCM10023141 TaxID=3252653 RepID=UPI00361E51C6
MTEIVPAHTVPFGDLSFGGRLARRMGYIVTGLPLCIVAFGLAVAGFSAGVSTLVVWVGLPILVATLYVMRSLAGVERRSAEWVTGRALPPHYYRAPRGSGIARLFSRLAEPQSWRDLLHAIVAFPVTITTFCVAVSWTVGGLGSLLYFAWEWSLPHGRGNGGLWWLITGQYDRATEGVVNTIAGALLVITSPAVVRAMVGLRVALTRSLLTNQTAALQARATQLESSRRSAVQAEAQTLRRVERDIHDGPQQRLVRLNMDLETVARRLDDAPEKAAPLVAEALQQSREALAELRALSRGIAPPILADRGLGPALAAAAARCPVQVSLDVALPAGKRLADAVENTAYFVVTEALTNVAKHAQASLVTVVVTSDTERVLVQVRDDGVGGAHLGKGHGLAGLADRLATVEGALDVVSPDGGPTILTAEIPLIGLGEMPRRV